MISGPILEELILSGKAIVRNVSVGGAGLVQVKVPEGKTWIITKIHILPFLNIIDPNNLISNIQTLTKEVLNQDFYEIFKRIQYQLLFYTPRINSVYNIRNKFGLETQIKTGDSHTNPHLYVDDQYFECFHITQDNFYLLLKYFDFENNQVNSAETYNLIFNGSQNWNPGDPYGYSLTTTDLNLFFDTFYNYYYQPQANPLGTPGQQDEFILPSGNSLQPNTYNFVSPIAAGGGEAIYSNKLPSIPFYNLTIIEVNKRKGTNGIL